MLNGRQCAAACAEQASKSSPTRLSGLIVKSEKEVYRREEYLSVACTKKEYSRTYKSEIIAMTRMRTTFSVVDTAHLEFSNTLAVVDNMMNDTSENKIDG